jgi:hypothetical protein
MKPIATGIVESDFKIYKVALYLDGTADIWTRGRIGWHPIQRNGPAYQRVLTDLRAATQAGSLTAEHLAEFDRYREVL